MTTSHYYDLVKSCRESLQSLVPRILHDEIVSCGNEITPSKFKPRYTERVAACLFADISGFTKVADAMQAQYGMSEGAERLSSALNSYFGSILDVVRNYDGDVMLFSGDAILVCWFVGNVAVGHKSLMDIKGACEACVRCGASLTQLPPMKIESGSVKIAMSLHLGASSGTVWTICCGGHQPSSQGKMKFVVTGAPLTEAGVAANAATTGEFFVHTNIFKECNDIKELGLGVVSVGDPLLFKFDHLNKSGHPESSNQLKAHRPAPISTSVTTHEKIISMFLSDVVLRHATKSHTGEIRTVSTVFIKLVQLSNISTGQMIQEKLQAVFAQIQKFLRRSQGICNKLLMDDKGIIALCVFGLPGYVHEDDPSRSIKFALKLSLALQQQGIVIAAGVSRARVFVGCCGNPTYRYEYTVLGDGVNISARLMSHANENIESNPMAVTCDEATFNDTTQNDNIDWGDPLKIQVKNKSDPITVYCPQLIKKKHSRTPSTQVMSPIASTKSDSESDFDDTASVSSCGSLKSRASSFASLPSPNANSNQLSVLENHRKSRGSFSKSPRFKTTQKDLAGRRTSRLSKSSEQDQDRLEDDDVAPPARMFGRGDEMTRLEKLFLPLEKKVMTRGSSYTFFVSVEGDSGSGKTHLLHWATSQLRSQKVPMHVLQGDESLSTAAYGVLKTYLSVLVEKKGIDFNWFLAEFDQEELEVLSALSSLMDIPELQDGHNLLTVGENSHVINKLVQDIFRHTVQGQYTLIVDDFQWLDPLTASFVLALVRAKVPTVIFRRPMKQGITFNKDLCNPEDDAGSVHSLQSEESVNIPMEEVETILNEVKALCDTAQHRVVLGPLDRTSFRNALCASVQCSGMDEEIVDGIYSRSEGNVGFAKEILRNLLDMGKVVVDESGQISVFDTLDVSESVHAMSSLQAVLLKSIDALSNEVQYFLGLLSVLGTRFMAQTLVKCYAVEKGIAEPTARSQVEVLLNELEDLNIIHKDHGPPHTMIRRKSMSAAAVIDIKQDKTLYAFSKSLLRDVVYHRLLVSERRRLHGIVAGVYATIPGMEPWKLAHHYVKSGDTDRAIALMVESALESRKNLDSRFALKHLKDIQAVVSAAGPGVVFPSFNRRRHKRQVLECLCDLLPEAQSLNMVMEALREIGRALPEKGEGTGVSLLIFAAGLSCCGGQSDDEIALLYLLAAEQAVVKSEVERARLCLVYANKYGSSNFDFATTLKAFNHISGRKDWKNASVRELAKVPLNVITSQMYHLTVGSKIAQTKSSTRLVSSEHSFSINALDGVEVTYRRMLVQYVSGCDEAANYVLLGHPTAAYDVLERLLKNATHPPAHLLFRIRLVYAFVLSYFRLSESNSVFAHLNELSKLVHSLEGKDMETFAVEKMRWYGAVIHLLTDVRNNITVTSRKLNAAIAGIDTVVLLFPCAMDTLALTALAEIVFTEFEKFRVERTYHVDTILKGLHRLSQVHGVAYPSWQLWVGMHQCIVLRGRSAAVQTWTNLVLKTEWEETFDWIRAQYCLAEIGKSHTQKKVWGDLLHSKMCILDMERMFFTV
eukprot:PhF_6_TR36374/c0_g1_i1/m.53440/K11265/ADCY10; adenylate cyclase 10